MPTYIIFDINLGNKLVELSTTIQKLNKASKMYQQACLAKGIKDDNGYIFQPFEPLFDTILTFKEVDKTVSETIAETFDETTHEFIPETTIEKRVYKTPSTTKARALLKKDIIMQIKRDWQHKVKFPDFIRVYQVLGIKVKKKLLAEVKKKEQLTMKEPEPLIFSFSDIKAGKITMEEFNWYPNILIYSDADYPKAIAEREALKNPK